MKVAADSDFLLAMAASSRLRDERARAQLSDAQQRSQLLCKDAPVPLVLQTDGFDVIAEIKKRSPAEGQLDGAIATAAQQVDAYVRGGAVALSVLTEPEQFLGSLDDLHEIAEQVRAVPVMRKDFLVSRYQVREARLAGASGVLLIAAILSTEQLKAMLDAAFELNMFVLLEAFDRSDIDTAVPILERCGPALDANGHCNYLLGVNCRDLRTLQVDFAHFERLAPALPAEMPWVAESGVSKSEQAALLATLGYRLALVGTALMRSADPAATLQEFRAAGVAACS